VSDYSSAPINENQQTTSAKKSTFSWFFLILLIALIGVAIVSAYQYKKLEALQVALASQKAIEESNRKSLELKLDESLAQQQKSTQAEVTELTQRLDSTAARVLALTTINRDDWKLTEVDYLLRMANQRILLEHETANALALAESANGLLAELESADLFPARKKLNEEIQALKIAHKVDREGIYLQLLAITQQVEGLQLIEPLVAEDSTMDFAQEDENQTLTFTQRAKRFGLRMWHKLSSYVRVRDQGRRVDAILPPEDQMYLKQNLRLMLEQAQTGLLREEQHVYQASLDKAQGWIRDYYPLNEQAEIVLNDLEQLKKNSVQQQLPDFSGSAALMKDYIRQKDRLAFSRHGGN
jgi:uroporphyrin-III C-methyltransferase